ncbi:MAG: hypothetical protein MZV70_50265 [Desulfobacterales bacterium]|nr:hypothetical protein [Desulfobacterales bacterium]
MFIRIEGKGITASTYFGLRHAGWEDIIALQRLDSFRGCGVISDFFASDYTLYKIYTHNRYDYHFQAALPGADEHVAELLPGNNGSLIGREVMIILLPQKSVFDFPSYCRS